MSQMVPRGRFFIVKNLFAQYLWLARSEKKTSPQSRVVQYGRGNKTKYATRLLLRLSEHIYAVLYCIIIYAT